MLKFDANLTLLFRELSLLDRFAAAKNAGFQAVELLSPEGIQPKELKKAADEAQVKVVLCNAPMGDFPQGGLGLSAIPSRKSEFRAGIYEVCEMAEILDCSQVHLGPSRVESPELKDSYLNTYIDNVNFASEVLNAKGIKVLIEAINSVDIPNILIDDIESALTIIEQSTGNNIQFQFDIYHLATMNCNIEHLLEQHFDKIGHIQFADVPDRAQPGTGTINFESIFNKLKSLGYNGWIGAEYIPSVETSKSLEWFKEY